MLAANNFAVPPSHLYIAAIVSVNSVMNAALRWSLHGWYGESLLMTPVDALDTLVVMGLKDEADDARELIA